VTGALIAFEGVYSCGKSTQVRLLAEWLRGRGVEPVVSEWNSSEIVADRIVELKEAGRLVPRALVLLEAADFADRYERVVGPALADGHVVLADRYIQSSIVRGVVRGVEHELLRGCFAYAPEPALVVHVTCPASETLARRLAQGKPIGEYLCGEDFRPVSDRRSAFIEYQAIVEEAYMDVLPRDALRVSSLDPPEALAAAIRDRVAPLLQVARSM